MELPPRKSMAAKVDRQIASSEVNRVIQEFTMSIPSIGNVSSGFPYPSTQSSSSKRNAAAGFPQNLPILSPDTVTLSPEAQALASLNAKGITMVTIYSRGLSSGQQPIQPSSVVDSSVSKTDFEAMAASFGEHQSGRSGLRGHRHECQRIHFQRGNAKRDERDQSWQ
jgi:hypothetical protein